MPGPSATTAPYVISEPNPVGEYTFFTDFENATDEFTVSHEPDEGCYTVSPGSWLHFGVRGVAGDAPTFRVDRPDHLDERRRYVWSLDGEEWHYFGNVRTDADWYYVDNDEGFENDTVYVAGLFPYRLSDLEDLLRDLRTREHVFDVGPRGYSPDRRPLYGLRVTDPAVDDTDKRTVVMMAGVHAWEAWGRQVFHGFLGSLVSDDPAARSLREKAEVFCYPMVNPDGITRGHMKNTTVDVNPNRVWNTGTPSEGTPSEVPEVDVFRRTIVDETDGEAAYFVDFHSHAGWFDHCMWYANGDDPEVAALVEATHAADDEAPGGAIVGTDMVSNGTEGGPVRKTSTRWARETLGATTATFEATPYSQPSRERYRQAGAAFVAGLDDVLD